MTLANHEILLNKAWRSGFSLFDVPDRMEAGLRTEDVHSERVAEKPHTGGLSLIQDAKRIHAGCGREKKISLWSQEAVLPTWGTAKGPGELSEFPTVTN